MIRKHHLVDNKHLQLQLLLIQFLSVALADSTDNNIVEMAENTTQTATSNQIGGKMCNKFSIFDSNQHSIICSSSFPRN